MRLTGGHAKGRVVPSRVAPGVRPTSSRVREALFSIVGQDLQGDRVLDAFAGAGVLGFEAWSRGADVAAVERHGETSRRLRAAADGLGANGRGWTLRVGDVRRVVSSDERFEGILADPPYRDAPEPWLRKLAPCATAWLVYEAPSDRALPAEVEGLAADRPRRFGGTTLWVYWRRGGPR